MSAIRLGRIVAGAALGLWSAALGAQQMGSIDSGCAQAQQTTAPHAVISNGIVNAVVYLPDAKDGYYRASRFDWSGSVACLAYKGHTYFGVWFPKYDPMINDAITGPVEEFRSADGKSAPFYDEAKPGELFVKPGVGVLRKVDEKPFDFKVLYPLVDGGKWAVHTSTHGVEFRQTLKSTMGVAYVYTKTLNLDSHAPVLAIEHTLKNTGSKTIDISVYEHDFYRLDNEPTGPAMSVRFPFEPAVTQPFKNGARLDDKKIVYDRELQKGETAQSGITGYSDKVSDYDFFIENSHTGAGVEQTADSPLASINFWSIRTTVCPEGYVHVVIPPGQTGHWTIKYRFYAK